MSEVSRIPQPPWLDDPRIHEAVQEACRLAIEERIIKVLKAELFDIDVDLRQVTDAAAAKTAVFHNIPFYEFTAPAPIEVRVLIRIQTEILGAIYLLLKGLASIPFVVPPYERPHTRDPIPIWWIKQAEGFSQVWQNKRVVAIRFDEVEAGGVTGYAVPRGLHVKMTAGTGEVVITVFRNQGDPDEPPPENPLLSVVGREFEDREKSNFVREFSTIRSPQYFQASPRGNETILSVGCPLGLIEAFPNIRLCRELDGLDPCGCFVFHDDAIAPALCTRFLLILLQRVQTEKVDYDVYSGFAGDAGSLPFYLSLESERVRNALGGDPISMREMATVLEGDRVDMLLKGLRRTELGVLWPRHVKCPICGAVYSYKKRDYIDPGLFECKNCLKRIPANTRAT